MARPSKDEVYDVSDSTDWLQTPLPSLAPVDSALRCQVCRDFYNTPMITSCSHTFCSLCIRHCLNNDAKCPTCRKGDQESKLRNNYAMEDLVEAFKSARPTVMELAKQREEALWSLSPKRKRAEAAVEEDDSQVHKRTRSSRRTQQSSQLAEVVDSEDDDENYVPGMVAAGFQHFIANSQQNKPKSRQKYIVPFAKTGFQQLRLFKTMLTTAVASLRARRIGRDLAKLHYHLNQSPRPIRNDLNDCHNYITAWSKIMLSERSC